MIGMTYPLTISTLNNPITRFDVRVEPPIEVRSEAELYGVQGKFMSYCKVAWDGEPDQVRCNPAMIPSDWLRPPPLVPA